jgi:hypothetical protein
MIPLNPGGEQSAPGSVFIIVLYVPFFRGCETIWITGFIAGFIRHHFVTIFSGNLNFAKWSRGHPGIDLPEERDGGAHY